MCYRNVENIHTLLWMKSVTLICGFYLNYFLKAKFHLFFIKIILTSVEMLNVHSVHFITVSITFGPCKCFIISSVYRLTKVIKVMESLCRSVFVDKIVLE